MCLTVGETLSHFTDNSHIYEFSFSLRVFLVCTAESIFLCLFSYSIQIVYTRLCTFIIDFILYLLRLVFLPEIFIFYSVHSRAPLSFRN